jgi:hypothetical protein
MFRRAIAVLVCALAFATPALAQEQRGSLEGTIKDAQGAVLPGAIVEARSAALIGVRSETADANGNYRFPALPPGTYQVTATLAGFQTNKSQIVQLSVGQTLKVDVTLALGGVTEAVQVTAESTVLDVASARTATTITAKMIEQLPRGRTFNTLLQMAPGVRAEGKSGTAGVGGYQFDGTSGSENVFVIDGVDVSNIRRASLEVQDAIPFEFVQEMQIKSGGFEAEFGGALGGVVNVISKSGSDTFHGEGMYQFSGSSLNEARRNLADVPGQSILPVAGGGSATAGKSFRRNPFDVTQAELFTPPEDDYNQSYGGFTLGGPIAKDKLRFFVGYIPERHRIERSINFLTASGESAGVKDSATTVLRHRGTGRLDYVPFQKLQVNASYFWNPQKTTGLLTSNDAKVAPPTSDLSKQGGYVQSNATTLGVNYLPSSKFLLSARYGYKYTNDKGNTYGKDDVPYLVYNTASNNGGIVVPSQYAGAAGFTNVASTFVIQRDLLTRHNLYLDGTFFGSAFGQNHTIKVGYALNRIGDDVNSNYTQGRFNINWGEGYTRGSIVGAQGPYGHYTWQDGVRLNSAVSSRNHGVYAQDAWQIHPRITVNVGVRVENEFLPPFRAEQDGVKIANPISFGWGDKIAPRVGAAWDILGNGRWKLSSSWVRVNDVLKYELARGSFGGDYWHDHVYTLDSPDLSQLSISNPGALGRKLIEIDNRTVPINASGQLEGIDPDMRPMSHNNFDVTTEYLIAPLTTFTLRYTHKVLRYGIEDIGVLDENESEVYTTGNPGFGLTSDSVKTPTGASVTPKAKRDYDGVEFRVAGRMTHFFYNASYTYSKLFGNWSGLASSDENGRSDPNVSRAFDLSPGNFDENGHNVYGRLGTDRPHTLKLFGNYAIESKLGTTMLGLSQQAFSGTPISSEVTFIVPIFYNGRGDLGRTDTYTQTDLLASHAFGFGGGKRMVLEAYVFNLFNQEAVTNITPRYNRNGSIPQALTADLYAGTLGDATQYVAPLSPTAAPSFNPIYNMPLGYQESRQIRLGVRFQF